MTNRIAREFWDDERTHDIEVLQAGTWVRMPGLPLPEDVARCYVEQSPLFRGYTARVVARAALDGGAKE